MQQYRFAQGTALSEIYSWVNLLKDSVESTLMTPGAEVMKESDEALFYVWQEGRAVRS